MQQTDILQGLRAICAKLPEAEEYVMHDHPSFRAGKKCFVIVGLGHGENHVTGVSIKVPLMDQPLYCQDPRFSVTPYVGQHGWVTLSLAAGVNWPELERLVVASYRGAALKRMLKALDG